MLADTFYSCNFIAAANDWQFWLKDKTQAMPRNEVEVGGGGGCPENQLPASHNGARRQCDATRCPHDDWVADEDDDEDEDVDELEDKEVRCWRQWKPNRKQAKTVRQDTCLAVGEWRVEGRDKWRLWLILLSLAQSKPIQSNHSVTHIQSAGKVWQSQPS